jgi:hypothetical protein
MRTLLSVALRCLSVITALMLAACTTWQPLARDSIGAPPARLPYALRITRMDSSRVTVLGPFVRQDTLFGRQARDTLAVPLEEVRSLDMARFSAVRTAAVLLAIPVALVVAYTIECGHHRCGASPTL